MIPFSTRVGVHDLSRSLCHKSLSLIAHLAETEGPEPRLSNKFLSLLAAKNFNYRRVNQSETTLLTMRSGNEMP